VTEEDRCSSCYLVLEWGQWAQRWPCGWAWPVLDR